MNIILIPVIMGAITILIMATCKPDYVIAKIGLGLVIGLFIWLLISVTQPLEILTKKRHQTCYADGIVGVTYKGKFYNLNKHFNTSLQNCNEVFIVEYKKSYYGLKTLVPPTFELIPITLDDKIEPLIGYDGKPVKGPE